MPAKSFHQSPDLCRLKAATMLYLSRVPLTLPSPSHQRQTRAASDSYPLAPAVASASRQPACDQAAPVQLACFQLRIRPAAPPSSPSRDSAPPDETSAQVATGWTIPSHWQCASLRNGRWEMIRRHCVSAVAGGLLERDENNTCIFIHLTVLLVGLGPQ
jgi:hypothetical protein